MTTTHFNLSSANRSLHRASWAIVFYTILIIAWGAWVRISGSGDGCGDHWPLCKGQAFPLGHSGKTWIEVFHRYSTALFGILVLLQLYAIRRITKCGNPARHWILFTLLFTLTEALIGRQLVKSGLVNESESLWRLLVMPLHLVNTSALLWSEVMTAESVRYGLREKVKLPRAVKRWGVTIAVGMMVLLTTGAVAALGSHLFPSSSLMDGLMQDLREDVHPALRLRILHPLLGLVVPLFMWSLLSYASLRAPTPAIQRMYKIFGMSVLGMMALGIATLTTLSPVWLQLLHLTMANVLVVLLSRSVFHTLRPGHV